MKHPPSTPSAAAIVYDSVSACVINKIYYVYFYSINWVNASTCYHIAVVGYGGRARLHLEFTQGVLERQRMEKAAIQFKAGPPTGLLSARQIRANAKLDRM